MKQEGEFGEERVNLQRQQLSEAQLKSAMQKLPDRHSMVGTFQFREFLVGQEQPRRQLVDIITKSPPGTVAVISESLGSGKSSLISMVRDSLINSGFATFEECLRVNSIDLDEDISFDEFYWSNILSDEKPKDFQSVKPKALFIEEFDIKSAFRHLQEGMRSASKFLGKDMPIMILSGDYSLRNSSLVNLINSPYEPIYVSLDPLTPDMLKKALEIRLLHAFGENQKIDMDSLFEPEFLTYLIPNTDPPTSTMRTSLTILQDIASALARDMKKENQPAQFSGALYEDWASTSALHNEDSYNSKMWHFVSWLHEYIRSFYNPVEPMRAMTISDFKDLYRLNDIADEEYPVIIKHLAAVGILQSVGTPYLYDEEKRFPEPYLPSQKTFLDAAFYPLSPKTPEEEKKEREMAERNVKLNRLNTLYNDGIIEESVFLQKQQEMLGLDKLLDNYLEGGIDRETFFRRRQELLGIDEDKSV